MAKRLARQDDAGGDWPALVEPGDFGGAFSADLRGEINLDYAATTPALRAAVEAVLRALPAYGSVHRGGGVRSRLTTDAYEQARTQIGAFFNAGDDRHVVFVRNTTEAINLVAASLPADSRVLCSPFEHHANLLPWRTHQVEYLPFARSANELVRDTEHVLRTGRENGCPFQVLAVSGASNVTGELLPIGALATVAHDHGAQILVDAAQLAPHRAIDAQQLDVDYLTVSGHKLYAPFGSGVLIVRHGLLDATPPLLKGGGAVRAVTLGDVAWADLPQRLEAGTPNVFGALALAAACSELSRFGLDRLERREQDLAERLWSGLDEIPGCRVLRSWGDNAARVGVATFILNRHSEHDVAARLAQLGIAVRSGLFCAHPLVAHLLGTDGAMAEQTRRARAGEQLGLAGAVRASVGVGVEAAHIDRLLDALADLAKPTLRAVPQATPSVDFHRHVWPEELIATLRERRQPPLLDGDILRTSEGRFRIDVDAHRPERALEALKQERLDSAVISLQPTLGIEGLTEQEAADLTGSYNRGAAGLHTTFPGTFRPLAAGEPQEGFAGLCISGRALLDLDTLAPKLDRLAELGQLLFVHPGPAAPPANTPSWWAAGVAYTAEMQTAFMHWVNAGTTRWPALPVVFAMLAGGAPIQLERLQSRGVNARHLTAANVLFETSSYGRLAIELSLASYGVDRIVYGSDSPVIDPQSTRSAVNALGKATADALYRTNPAALLTR